MKEGQLRQGEDVVRVGLAVRDDGVQVGKRVFRFIGEALYEIPLE